MTCEYGGDGISNDTIDTIIVTNKWFELYDHNAPNYNGDDLPWAMAYSPLHSNYPWLDLFGF